MIRRLFHIAASFLCVLSLLVCVGAGWLWWRSYRTDRDRINFQRGGVWYTFRSSGGRVTLFQPPPPSGSKPTRQAVADLVLRLRNDQIRWGAYLHIDGQVAGQRTISITVPAGVSAREGTTASLLSDRQYTTADVTRPLLDALDDSERFAAAHLLLTERHDPAIRGYWDDPKRIFRNYGTWDWAAGSHQGPDDVAQEPKTKAVATFNGLRVGLRVAEGLGEGEIEGVIVDLAARVDPAQIPATANWMYPCGRHRSHDSWPPQPLCPCSGPACGSAGRGCGDVAGRWGCA